MGVDVGSNYRYLDPLSCAQPEAPSPAPLFKVYIGFMGLRDSIGPLRQVCAATAFGHSFPPSWGEPGPRELWERSLYTWNYQNLLFCRVPINSILGIILRTYSKVGYGTPKVQVL